MQLNSLSLLAAVTAIAVLTTSGVAFVRFQDKTGQRSVEIALSAGAPESQFETIPLKAGSFSIRAPGEFVKADLPVDGPVREVAFTSGFDIMKYQVSVADYRKCVTAGACQPAELAASAQADHPVTGVSFRDATAYARWLSQTTGENWRLPTDAEWSYAAGDRYVDDGLGLDDDGRNPSRRWLARYASETSEPVRDVTPMPRGHFGANNHGVYDVSGNVWDWTTTCYTRAGLKADGTVDQSTENCGVRIAGGKHRSYMSSFLRDGKSGGCAAGKAPDNLGIRLVREPASS